MFSPLLFLSDEAVDKPAYQPTGMSGVSSDSVGGGTGRVQDDDATSTPLPAMGKGSGLPALLPQATASSPLSLDAFTPSPGLEKKTCKGAFIDEPRDLRIPLLVPRPTFEVGTRARPRYQVTQV